MLRHPWTPEDEAALKEMAEKGVYMRRIALRLRRSESSIKKRAVQLGVRVPPTPRPRLRFGSY